MTLGTRGKIFAVSLGLVVVVVLAAGAYLEGALRHDLERSVEGELLRHARTVREVMRSTGVGDASAELTPLARRLARASGARVTIVRRDGLVLADSVLADADVASAENHRSRPEIAAALQGGQRGRARRYSKTQRTEVLYVALPYGGAPAPRGVVRVSLPLDDVNRMVSRLRAVLAVAGLFALAVAVLVSALASHLLSRTLRQLVQAARRIARGEGSRRLYVSSSDELGSLAGSFNRLAEEMRATVSTLAQERDRFETVLEEMSEAVLALDEDQRITLVNPAAVSLLELRAPPIGEPLLEIVRVPVLKELVAQCRDIALPSAEFDIPGQTPRRVLARATPLRGTGGSVLVMHDITEMRRLETIRRDFVANVSHELRTPVSIILANSETLLEGAIDDPRHARGFVQALARNAERLSRIIADLLDLSRIESGQYTIDSSAVEAGQAARRAVEAVEAMARDKQISIESTAADDLQVRADSKLLDQILLNLLHNAVKYTPGGGRIAVHARQADGMVRFEVEDNGVGVAPRHRDRIFERFYRVDPGRSRDMGDTGLGLSIVKHLAEAMGGAVGFDPAEPRGSIFWFTVPAVDEEPEPAAPTPGADS